MNCENHTPCPAEYIAWHKWARKMERTHKQTKCPACKLWKVWVIKPTLKGKRCVTKSEKERRKERLAGFNFK